MSLLWEKIQEVDGKINIQTSKNAGTAIRIKIPANILDDLPTKMTQSASNLEHQLI